jgi:hypothetical protein
MRPPRARALATLVAVGTLLSMTGGPAKASPPPPEGAQPLAPEPPVAVTVSGTCPDREAIAKAIASIVPAKDLDRFASSSTVEVSDLGETYRVSVNANGVERLRVYRDLARDCEHRARFAAVFIVLTLLPPDVLLDALPPPPPPPPVPPPPAPPKPAVVIPPPPGPAPRLRVELSASIDVAPRSGVPLAVALGGELRVAPGPKRLGPVGALGLAGGSIDFGAVRATELRLPFDLGLRLPLVTRTAFDLVGDVGLAGAVFHDRATNTPEPKSGTRLDLGARAGIVAHAGRLGHRLLGIAGVHGMVFPRTYDVTLTPQGTVGQTPAFWLGATLGLAVQP